MSESEDEYWMQQCISIARTAPDRPFGTVIVGSRGGMWSQARGTGSDDDPLDHCECRAITAACRHVGSLLHGCTLYSTHQPCLLCCGAICHSKVSRVVWGSDRADLPLLFRQRIYGARQLLQDTSKPPEVVDRVLHKECVELFHQEVEVELMKVLNERFAGEPDSHTLIPLIHATAEACRCRVINPRIEMVPRQDGGLVVHVMELVIDGIELVPTT